MLPFASCQIILWCHPPLLFLFILGLFHCRASFLHFVLFFLLLAIWMIAPRALANVFVTTSFFFSACSFCSLLFCLSITASAWSFFVNYDFLFRIFCYFFISLFCFSVSATLISCSCCVYSVLLFSSFFCFCYFLTQFFSLFSNFFRLNL